MNACSERVSSREYGRTGLDHYADGEHLTGKQLQSILGASLTDEEGAMLAALCRRNQLDSSLYAWVSTLGFVQYFASAICRRVRDLVHISCSGHLAAYVLAGSCWRLRALFCDAHLSRVLLKPWLLAERSPRGRWPWSSMKRTSEKRVSYRKKRCDVWIVTSGESR